MPRSSTADRAVADESPHANKSPSTRDHARARPDVAAHADDARDTGRMVSRPGTAYAGDHKNHGEEEIADDDIIEELDLDEMPSFEGPDA